MSTPTPPTDNPIASLTHQAHARLERISHTPFSPAGFEALKSRVDQYIADLILESVRIMERRQADTISPKYVTQASENLVASTRRRTFSLLGTFGGILLGAAVSSYANMIEAGSTTIPFVIFASAMAILGAFLIAIQFTKE
jgi:hypothetical protein